MNMAIFSSFLGRIRRSNICLLLITILVMIVNQSAFAQYNLVVWTSDDENTIFNFEEKPVITIEGEYWKVTSNQKVIQYAAKDIVKITLEEVDDAQPNPTSVSLSQLAPSLRVVQRDAQLLLFNCKAKTAVKVFMATGQYVGSYRTDYEGSLVIDLANYAPGVYILKVDMSTIIFIRK